MNKTVTLCLLILLAGVGLFLAMQESKMESVQLDNLRVQIGHGSKVPDPANIVNAGEWYFLYHISAGLISFNQDSGSFGPLYSKNWEVKDKIHHIFQLDENIKFHDGSPITVYDIEASIKRLLIKKTSTHFPLWDYLQGCENLKNLEDDCTGLTVLDEKRIQFSFKEPVASFYLQIGSPETGIWSKDDIDPKTLEITPSKFSGPYYVEKKLEDKFVLKRNENCPIIKEFPNAPLKMELVRMEQSKTIESFQTGELDLFVTSYEPFGDRSWIKKDTGHHKSTPSTMTYLQTLSPESSKKFGRDFVQALWSTPHDEDMVAAETFLPIGGDFLVNKETFLSQLPEKTAKKITVAAPKDYYRDGFLGFIEEAAISVGSEVEFHRLELGEYFELFEPQKDPEYDFLISPYAASERYPAVQLRFIGGHYKNSELDLKKTENPQIGEEEKQILVDYQKWLLSTQIAIPLFMYSTEIFFHPDLDIGKQPKTDAEIELWRVQKAVK
jgi:hypothetical protein